MSESIRRVCMTCRRLIVGENEPGEPSGAPTPHDSHGLCRVCLDAFRKDMESGKYDRPTREGAAINPLVLACFELSQEGYHPSAVRAEQEHEGHWLVSISLSDFVPLGEGDDQIGPYTVTIKRDKLPTGVSLGGFDHVPPHTFELDVTEQEMAALMQELAKAGQAMDVARFDYGGGRVVYLTKPNRWFHRHRRTASDEPVASTVFQGMLIAIEHPAGSVRRGTDHDGQPWESKMDGLAYGYIVAASLPDYAGGDGDSVDCFLKDPPSEQAKGVYVIHTRDKQTGAPDEIKCMLGWDSVIEATWAFLKAYNGDKRFYGGCRAYSIEQFRQQLAHLRQKQKAGNRRRAGYRKISATLDFEEIKRNAAQQGVPFSALVIVYENLTEPEVRQLVEFGQIRENHGAGKVIAQWPEEGAPLFPDKAVGIYSLWA